MKLDSLAALNRSRRERTAVILVTDMGSGAQRLVAPEAIAADPLAVVLAERLTQGRSGLVEADGRSYFLSVHVPPVRLVATGAVHISQALAPMARLVDIDVTIIDPRTAFATPERFPDVRLLPEWPDEALAAAPLDRYTAFVALTHDPKIDDPALAAALRSECFYIGALGSRKTHAKRLDRLRQAGFGEADVARIHAPIGIDIGAVSPAEIAVAILGEIIATLRREHAERKRAA